MRTSSNRFVACAAGPRLALALWLAFALVAQPAVADLPDPSGPPSVEEHLFLYSLTLTEDMDDGLNGETEIFVQINVEHNGHSVKWIAEFDAINMDPPNETSFKVLDGSLTAPERKGGARLVFNHMECEPTPSMLITIQTWEIDSEWISDVLDGIGEALGKASVPTDYSLGVTLAGAAATAAAKVIKALGNGKEDIGSESFDVPVGLSAERAPTTKYKYQMKYDKLVLDPNQCLSAEQPVLHEKLSDPTLPEPFRTLYSLEWEGWDEEHPFTKNPDRAQQRQQKLQQALAAVDLGGMEPGADSTGLAADRDTMRVAIADAGRDPLATEIQEAIANGLDPGLISGAQSRLAQGDAYAGSGYYPNALQEYATGFQMLVAQNHPGFVVSVEGGPEIAPGPRFIAARPNPTAGRVSFAVQLPRAERLLVQVLDPLGRRVATLADRRFEPGLHQLEWDGRTGSGAQAPDGVYFVKLDGKSGQDVAKVVVTR